jgi:hypothetical protein
MTSLSHSPLLFTEPSPDPLAILGPGLKFKIYPTQLLNEYTPYFCESSFVP